MLNHILQRAPSYGDVGPPIYMVMFEVMNTFGGFSTLLSTQLNAEFQKMFKWWTNYLTTEASCHVLDTTAKGWVNSSALVEMSQYFPGLTFPQIYKCEPDQKYLGYKSWDHFFSEFHFFSLDSAY